MRIRFDKRSRHCFPKCWGPLPSHPNRHVLLTNPAKTPHFYRRALARTALPHPSSLSIGPGPAQPTPSPHFYPRALGQPGLGQPLISIGQLHTAIAQPRPCWLASARFGRAKDAKVQRRQARSVDQGWLTNIGQPTFVLCHLAHLGAPTALACLASLVGDSDVCFCCAQMTWDRLACGAITSAKIAQLDHR